jgi:hypothetical protein
MGYIRHNAIVVTGDGYDEAEKKFELAYRKANELFDGLVSNVIKGKINGYQSFFVAPDGSKEGWEISVEYDSKRKELADYIDSLAYSDGSNCIQFVDVGFDEIYEAEVDRTNKERPDGI